MAEPPPPSWLTQVQQFVQLSDLPTLEQRTPSQQLRCLHLVAAAVAETAAPGDGSGGGGEPQAVLERCREAESLLQRHDLLELTSRAAQQEKEQLQSMFKGASDEAAHLGAELAMVADAARRTAVQLRGRDTGGWRVCYWIGGE